MTQAHSPKVKRHCCRAAASSCATAPRSVSPARSAPSLPFAQADDLAPYRAAKINWRQAEGQEITVAVIPASYFENLITLSRSSRR